MRNCQKISKNDTKSTKQFYGSLKIRGTNVQVNPTDISCKKQRKNSQSKIMLHCSYLKCPTKICTAKMK